MRDARTELEATGAEIVFVGMGTPAHASAFKRHHDLPFRLLVDDKRESHGLAGMKRGTLRQVVGPDPIRRSFRAFRRGGRLGRVKQDPMQLGGAVVVAPGGKIVWRYVAASADDNPGRDEVLEGLSQLSQIPRPPGSE